MVKKSERILNDTLYNLLQKECFAIVSTADAETWIPYVNAISWIYARNKETMLMAIDTKSTAVKNVKANGNMSVTLFGDETTTVISGEAEIMGEPMAGVPIKLSLIALKITEVRDAMFYGARIAQPPVYEKTYDPQAAAKLDRQVMEAMKNS